MFFDLALTYDKAKRRCDLTLAANCDLAIDETPVTPIILSVGLDRRAAPDDPLPEGRSQFLTPVSFSERRGAIGDALDPFGALTGSKMWLLDRAKQTETTRLMAEYWLEEALEWAAEGTGKPAEIAVEWLAPGILSYRVTIEDTSVSLSKRVE